MKNIFIFLILFFISTLSYACKDINYDYVVKINPKELAKEGCTKQHLQLLKANDVDTIKIVNNLKKAGLADKSSLNLMAFSYYRQGNYKEALSSRLASNKSKSSCLLLAKCMWDADIILHYQNAVFYRAAGLKENYEREMWIGDIHFFETCPLWSNIPNADKRCTQTRNRYINGVYEMFGHKIVWDYNSDGYLSLFND
ncbi:hypothetical protein [Methylomonas fluvii]|uniref:Uncharacterized protein n=1 Tax=Methylomonas fluvii TaxID=1854564 RepID=A0ABR9DBK3_9GAMM|nr:hypothetical protein [Methylomonas fluvii]MBD9359693.1 hypothetical protein [Methylomonas fluvii]CAD6872444.1 hypothetical protein [Methylomonas fluvii]